MIAALHDPGAYDHPVARVECLETHISWVLLTGTFAYKIKKPVNLGFVDFSTPERRHWFCQEELRLNRRLAPDLYLGLSTVHGPRERATFRGSGPTIETAVRMRQFPQEALLPEVLGRGGLDDDQLERLADDLAAFHEGAAAGGPGDPYGTAECLREPAVANLEVLEAGEAQVARSIPPSGGGPRRPSRVCGPPLPCAGGRAASGSAMGICTWATCSWKGITSRSSTAWSSVLPCAGST